MKLVSLQEQQCRGNSKWILAELTRSDYFLDDAKNEILNKIFNNFED